MRHPLGLLVEGQGFLAAVGKASAGVQLNPVEKKLSRTRPGKAESDNLLGGKGKVTILIMFFESDFPGLEVS